MTFVATGAEGTLWAMALEADGIWIVMPFAKTQVAPEVGTVRVIATPTQLGIGMAGQADGRLPIGAMTTNAILQVLLRRLAMVTKAPA